MMACARVEILSAPTYRGERDHGVVGAISAVRPGLEERRPHRRRHLRERDREPRQRLVLVAVAMMVVVAVMMTVAVVVVMMMAVAHRWRCRRSMSIDGLLGGNKVRTCARLRL